MRLFKKVTSTVTSNMKSCWLPLIHDGKIVPPLLSRKPKPSQGLSILEQFVLRLIDLSHSTLRIRGINRLRKFEVTGVICAVLISVLSNCNYKGSNNSDIQGKAILNFQRGLNTKSVGISVSCDTDTPSVATKRSQEM